MIFLFTSSTGGWLALVTQNTGVAVTPRRADHCTGDRLGAQGVMFKEAQLYAPITTADDGSVTVHLDETHPGFGDPRYRARRNQIAARALRWGEGDGPGGWGSVPIVEYTEEEEEVWRRVCRELAAKHARLACAEYRAAMAALSLPADHIPQLPEVSARLQPRTGFRYHPAAGLVPFEQFYGSLADGVFHST